MYFLIAPVVILLFLLFSALRIFNEYERGVIFTLGRYTGTRGPGLVIVIPVAQRMVRMDLRTIALDVPTQDVISRDNVSVKVSAVVYFRIVDPARAVIQVAKRVEATSQLAQITLRSVLGQHELDEIPSQRDKLNLDIQQILDHATDAWGIKVATVEIKHVDLNEKHDPRHGQASRSRTNAPRQNHPRRRRETSCRHAGGSRPGAQPARPARDAVEIFCRP